MNKCQFNSNLWCTSSEFVGVPYEPDPLGEGFFGEVDTDPLYRFDAYDCVTFVETMMAVSSAASHGSFMKHLNAIRYRDGVVGYGYRNHFFEADWAPNNTAAGYVRDVTRDVGWEKTQFMSIFVDKEGWLGKNDAIPVDQYQQLSSEMDNIYNDSSEYFLEYIPVNTLIDELTAYQSDEASIIDFLPDESIFVLIRKKERAQEVGTMVAHTGLLFHFPKGVGGSDAPTLRHASRGAGMVADTSLLEFLKSQEHLVAGAAFYEVIQDGNQYRDE